MRRPHLVRVEDAESPWPPTLRSRAARGVVGITYGTFDLFHVGHVNLFRRIRERCDTLVVAVSTDEFNAVKRKRAVVRFADRLEIVRACRYVDLAIAEASWEQKRRDIAAYGVDVFVMGSDWAGRFDDLRSLCRVVYLPRTEGVSTSVLRDEIAADRPLRRTP